MARRKIPKFEVLWSRHVALYIDIFLLAMHELQKKHKISGSEDEISEILCLLLNDICFEREIQRPIAEIPIQPVHSDELKGGLRKQPRPDFTCFLLNRFAALGEEWEIPLHIECKCLGIVTSSQWNLNKKYVKDGIQRFDNTSHQYGKRATSGIMIGYIIGMTQEKILKQINYYQSEIIPGNISIVFNPDFQTGIYQAVQHLNRSIVEPKNFELYHLWVDIKHNYSKK